MNNETKKMMNILHENKEKVRLERIEKERNKKEAKRTILTIIFLIVLIIILLMIMGKENNDFLTNCVKGGLSESVCRLSM